MDARNSAMAVALAPQPAGFSILAQRLLNLVLFITVLTSSIAFIEPSPHDLLMLVLLVTCVGARVGFDHKLVPLLALLIVWLVGGLLCLIQVGDNAKDIQYAGTSLYLGLAAIMFACLFCDGDLLRLAIMRRAYIIAALIATAAGYIGFFHLLPGADIFLENDRVSATFKDPNVYGPFLIFPIVWLLIGLLTRGIMLLDVSVLAVLLGGLLLSFSRGAWAHFVISATVGIAIVLAVTPDPRMRARIIVFGLLGAVVAALLIVAAMSIGSVHDMFVERAKAIQPYDVGPGGRFWQQQLAINAILDNPNGLGPFEFDRIFGLQQHNVYMQGFLVYGWLGGAAYFTLVAVTLVFGLLTVTTRTPWQYYLITAYAVFVGEAFEGMIVDTDHWRHFFLMLGLVWGLGAATINERRRQAWGIEPDDGLLPADS
jgi:O-antigen ligase/polysaccharide polymerase Wzy-like membrane protein